MKRLLIILATLILAASLSTLSGPTRPANAATPYACFYRDANYSGPSLCVNATGGRWFNFRDYSWIGWNPDNQVSSVCTYGGRTVLASGLNGNNYELLGRLTVYCTSYLGSVWNDKASSFYIGYY